MSSVAEVLIDASQFPENVRRDLLKSLRTRRVNHKFHYDSVKQTQKWLALHQRYSPTRNNADCQKIYERAFHTAAGEIKSKNVHVIGLGCGGGQKDTRLLRLLKGQGKKPFYTPCDVSTAMVLTARRTALSAIPEKNCFPVACDLATAGNVRDILVTRRPSLVTFFGMIPNFEPQEILPKLASLIRPKDILLFSANLAPGMDYGKGVREVLPQYDNEFTRDWLMTLLRDLGIERRDGQMRFEIENGQIGLKRIVARFRFRRAFGVELEDETFRFKSGDMIRLFFSYRYTPERVRSVLSRYGLNVGEQWISNSGQEGVFLCRRL